MSEDKYNKMMSEMDDHIDHIIKRPAMYAGEFSVHSMAAAEGLIMTLLGYRYDDGVGLWQAGVREVWPEERSGPGSIGWLVQHFHADDKDWSGWSKTAAKVIDIVRRRRNKDNGRYR
jgi:hypothetical protein